jgi:hypothetical protein
MPKKAQPKKLAEAWEKVKNNSDTYCVGVEMKDDDICIYKILEKGKLLGWRLRREDKFLKDLPPDYDMTQFGEPIYLEETGSFKKIAKEWEKMKKNAESYYIAIIEENGLHLGTYIHKILKNGELTGWRVKEKGKPIYDLPANYDMAQFGFPGESQSIADEHLYLEFLLDMKNWITPPLTNKDIEAFAKNPAFIKSLKLWEKEILHESKIWLMGEG